jgi:hypothetical protein
VHKTQHILVRPAAVLLLPLLLLCCCCRCLRCMLLPASLLRLLRLLLPLLLLFCCCRCLRCVLLPASLLPLLLPLLVLHPVKGITRGRSALKRKIRYGSAQKVRNREGRIG